MIYLALANISFRYNWNKINKKWMNEWRMLETEKEDTPTVFSRFPVVVINDSNSWYFSGWRCRRRCRYRSIIVLLVPFAVITFSWTWFTNLAKWDFFISFYDSESLWRGRHDGVNRCKGNWSQRSSLDKTNTAYSNRKRLRNVSNNIKIDIINYNLK